LKGCHNLVSLIGYTWERDIKGIVYDINPLDTLDNVIKKGNAILYVLYMNFSYCT